MTERHYHGFIRRVQENPSPCCHGHIDCSDRPGGRCSDEEYPLALRLEEERIARIWSNQPKRNAA